MGKPIAVDLFCGVGGMALGFHDAGFDIRVAVDVCPRNVELYSINFPNTTVLNADISNISAESILSKIGPSNCIDVLFGGPPCQGFSIMGRRDQSDPRNSLIMSFARLVRELRPRTFVFENVPGLTQGVMVSQLKSFVDEIARSGYRISSSFSILNAKNFGVPQSRERLFIIGSRTSNINVRGFSRAINCPSVWDAIGDLPEVDLYPHLLHTDRFTRCLGSPTSKYAERLRFPNKNVAVREEGIGGCGRTVHSPDVISRFQQTSPGSVEAVSRFVRLSPTGIAPTLRAGTGSDRGSHTAPRPIHPYSPRCITIREAARLHSYPDWFEFDCVKWHGLRQIGNSVPPLLARAVARRVAECV